ncbi:pyridoxal-phosphate dependent enzyme [Streptomyces sp. HB132]|uniref:threonine synthase n=1 Tax=Streptomyces sp. HB132 TaxID=767388 RepID=UPI0019600F01|nr:pyridoxal-phosphate dependent enzyme [Streptomyces sp. HB132]MBM7442880.1 threonine synthase [Streptomyces sp. HB132]
MRAKFVLVCMLCQSEFDAAPMYRCPECTGALEPRYELSGMVRHDHADPEQVYFDLLPLASRDFLDSGVTVRTPCRPAPRLGEAIGVPGLWIKDESRQPTRTTKDRLASLVTSVLRQFGVKEFVGSSTGNSSTALARAVRMDPTMRARFFCGKDFVANHDIPDHSRTALTVVDGSYVDASAEARGYAAREGIHFDAGFFNWARREGLKLAYLEAFDAMDRAPDVVVQAISSGMGMLAAHKGAREYLALGELSAMPAFLMVQEESCAPAARGWQEGRTELSDAHLIEDPRGLATAILLGDGSPYYPYLHSIAAGTGGAIVSAARADLVTARRMLSDLEDVDVCYASAAAVAAVRDGASSGRISPDETVLVNLTGRSRMVDGL